MIRSSRRWLAVAALAMALLIAGVAVWRLGSMENRVRGLLGKIDPKIVNRSDIPAELVGELRELGPDSLPLLFRIISDTSPPVRLDGRLRLLAIKIGLPLAQPETMDRLRRKASWAIQLHGTNALPLLPDFRLLLSGTNLPYEISDPATRAVASIGTNGLRLLVSLLGSPNESLRRIARSRLIESGACGRPWTLDAITSYKKDYGNWDTGERAFHLQVLIALGGKPVESLRLFQNEFLEAPPTIADLAAFLAGIIFIQSQFPSDPSNAGSWTPDELSTVREARPIFARQLKDAFLKEPDPDRRARLLSYLVDIDREAWLELQQTVIPSQKSPP